MSREIPPNPQKTVGVTSASRTVTRGPTRLRQATHLSQAPFDAECFATLRGRWADVFWFSVFHEIGYVVLHGRRATFVDGHETEADEFAADQLIPRAAYAVRNRPPTEETIRAFARQIGVAPGIVVGRMQHDGVISYSACGVAVGTVALRLSTEGSRVTASADWTPLERHAAPVHDHSVSVDERSVF